MNQATQKIVQYLEEARASEVGLVRVLQSQIAMTPRGSYRRGLETHLRETRDHARRVEERLQQLGHGDNPIQVGIGLAETVFAQALALGKTPIDLIRGSGGEEKVLKNAKDAAATEALEIATYTAIERLARSVGDDRTAQLAASIRADEEQMLERILTEIPKLTDAVVGADVHGDGSYDVTKTGAADAARSTATGAADAARSTATGAADSARSTARAGKSRAKQATRTAARKTGVAQPWVGYDKLTVEQIRDRLSRATDEKAREVRTYERAHKNRRGVIEATDRELASA
jgi:ferritin-like metal-binding protein YciE